MKPKIYLAYIFSLFTFIASAQEKKTPNFVLKGTFIGKHAQAIFLTYKDENGKKIEHKANIKNGIFSFRGFIANPVYGVVTSDIKMFPNDPVVSNAVEIFLSSGNLTLSLQENDFEHAVLTGSPIQDEWINLLSIYKPINKIKDSLYSVTTGISRTDKTPKNDSIITSVAAKIDECNFQIDQINFHYISFHPQSYLSAYLLNNFIGGGMRLDSIEMLYNNFPQSVKKSIEGKEINKVIISRKSSAVGSVVEMPQGTNLDGSRFDPQKFEINNYLLLYFWAGYANDNADLKAIYNKYQAQGLRTIAISMEPFKKMWRNSVKRDQIGMWHNIFSGLSADLDTFYNIRQMAPSLVLLVDKNYTIIGRYRGQNKFYKMDYSEEPIGELDKKLAKLIN